MSMPVYPTGQPEFPVGRPVYPTSRPDVESASVEPDIQVPADRALKTAHLTALQKKLERDPGRKGELEPIISGLKKELEAPAPKP